MFKLKKIEGRYLRLCFVALAFVFALLFDLLLWNQHLGLGFLSFVVIYLVLFTGVVVVNKQMHQPRALLLLIPILTLSLDIVLYNNFLVSNWVHLFVLVLLFCYSFLLTLNNPEKHAFSFSKIPILSQLNLPFNKLAQMYNDIAKSEKEKKNDLYRKIAVALIISLPILFVFGALFAGADAVFADLVKKVFFFNINEDVVARIFRISVLTVAAGSFFYIIMDSAYILGEKKISAIKLDNTIVGIILSLMNVLFLIFVIIQINYLFGSRDFVLNNSMSFAEYARSGFFQLCWVIVFASLMLIFFYRSSSHHGGLKLLNALKVLLILQVGVIAVSALKRMNLYQAEFGYTVLRLYVEWFIYFAMTILCLAAVSILSQFKFRNFLYSSMVCGVVALTIVSSINVDRIITRQNVDRFVKNGKELDLDYLSLLSVDKIEILFEVKNSDKFNNEEIQTMKKIFSDAKKKVAEYDSWREINLSVLKLQRQDEKYFNDVK